MYIKTELVRLSRWLILKCIRTKISQDLRIILLTCQPRNKFPLDKNKGLHFQESFSDMLFLKMTPYSPIGTEICTI